MHRASRGTRATATPRRGADAPAPSPEPANDAPRHRSLNRRVLKASEQLVHTLLEDIVREGLKPGDRLPQEPEMVQKYGVARATVREALRILEINGMITVRVGPGGGPTVRSATPADFGRAMSLFLQAEGITLEELFRARQLIEPILVRDAAEQQDEAYQARARDLVERGRTLDVSDDHAYISITREFHELTVSGSPNRVFKMFSLGLMSMFVGSLNKAIHPIEKRKEVLKEHEDILKAILARNPAKAEKLMTMHMQAVQEIIASRYQNSYQEVVSWL